MIKADRAAFFAAADKEWAALIEAAEAHQAVREQVIRLDEEHPWLRASDSPTEFLETRLARYRTMVAWYSGLTGEAS